MAVTVGLETVRVTLPGITVQVIVTGPEQVRVTVPVNPFEPVSASGKTAVPPGCTVAVELAPGAGPIIKFAPVPES